MSVVRLTVDQVQRGLHGIAYEIFVQSFFDSNGDGIGDLNGLREKLDYLSELGITLIWLMPIHPAKTYHKYDVQDYTGIHADYGTLDDFRCLVNECHQRGILLILDLVANHTSYDHPWFRQAQSDATNPYREYYIWADGERVRTAGVQAFDTHDANPAGMWHRVGPESEHFDWETFTKKPKRARIKSGQADTYYALFDPRMPDLNYDCDRVHEEICRIGRTWLELGVDGFRLDAAKYFYKPSRLASNLAWWKKFREEMSRINPSVYLIGEVWDSSSRIAPYLRSLDSAFNFPLAEMLISCILNERHCSSMLNNYAQILNTYAKESQRVVIDAIFLSNHDQNRVMSMVNNDLTKAKLAAAFLLTLPGLPFIYYGEEIGMQGMKPPDKYLREPFLWSSTHTTGQTTWLDSAFTNVSQVCRPWDEQQTDPDSLLNHYKRLIRLRGQSDQLRLGSFKPIRTNTGCLCLFEREYEHRSVFIAHNVGSREQRITLPESRNQKRVELLFSTRQDTSLLEGDQVRLPGCSSIVVQLN